MCHYESGSGAGLSASRVAAWPRRWRTVIAAGVGLSVVGTLALAMPTRATAWHSDGHLTIARVAWKQLNAGEQLRVTKILRAHPHYDVFLADARPRDLASEAEWVFARAAVWADWVRDPMGPGLDAARSKALKKQFNKPLWHYIDLPFVHPKDVEKFDEAAIRKQILEPALNAKGEPRHALAALEHVTKQLKAADTSDADRAVALCWLMHLVGDLHQPLHGAALISIKPAFDPPGGDRGGNLLGIKIKPDDPKAVNLHYFWDSLLFQDEPGYAAVEGLAARLVNDPKLQRAELPELKATEFLAWADESLELAKTVVYKHDGKFLKLRSLPRFKLDLTGLDAPPLPDGYQEVAEKIAARRMVLAGYRLADQIRRSVTAGN